MEPPNDASACGKYLSAAVRQWRVGQHWRRLALPEHGRMGLARHQMKPLVDWHQSDARRCRSAAPLRFFGTAKTRNRRRQVCPTINFLNVSNIDQRLRTVEIILAGLSPRGN